MKKKNKKISLDLGLLGEYHCGGLFIFWEFLVS